MFPLFFRRKLPAKEIEESSGGDGDQPTAITVLMRHDKYAAPCFTADLCYRFMNVEPTASANRAVQPGKLTTRGSG